MKQPEDDPKRSSPVMNLSDILNVASLTELFVKMQQGLQRFLGDKIDAKVNETRDMVLRDVHEFRAEDRRYGDGKFNDVDGKLKELRAEVKETRGDVKELRGEVKEVREDVKETRGDVKELRAEVKESRAEDRRYMDGKFKELYAILLHQHENAENHKSRRPWWLKWWR